MVGWKGAWLEQLWGWDEWDKWDKRTRTERVEREHPKTPIMPWAVECSKLGFDWASGFGWASLGLPQGNVKNGDFIA